MEQDSLSSNKITTDIDLFRELIEKNKKVTLKTASKELKVDEDIIDKYAEILSKNNIITAKYPIFGSPVYHIIENKKTINNDNNNTKPIDSNKTYSKNDNTETEPEKNVVRKAEAIKDSNNNISKIKNTGVDAKDKDPSSNATETKNDGVNLKDKDYSSNASETKNAVVNVKDKDSKKNNVYIKVKDKTSKMIDTLKKTSKKIVNKKNNSKVHDSTAKIEENQKGKEHGKSSVAGKNKIKK